MVPLILLFIVVTAQCVVVPSEIMYNPRQGQDYEYIELHNTAPTVVSIAGWNFTNGVYFSFPQGASIPPDGYVILANKLDFFMQAYANLLPSNTQVYGNPTGGLQDNGETITLVDDNRAVVFSFRYSDDSENFPASADGFGSSLELVCDTVANFSDPNSWVASPLPGISDGLIEYSGSPGRRSSWYSCPPPNKYITPKVFWSEVMYHPVKEVTKEDIHEFIEFYNSESTSLSIANWKVASATGLLSSLRFTFPANSVVPPNSYFILAKNVTAFNSIYTVPINTPIFGGYFGELGNGGDKLYLFDDNGLGVEGLSYDTKFPWPIAADALGAGQDWLSVNLTNIQFKGMSLERVTFNISTSKKYNWVANVPTPGAVNTGNRITPNPIVTEMDFTQSVNSSDLLPNLPISITVKFGPKGLASNPTLEYFIDDIYQNNEPINSIPFVVVPPASNEIYQAGIPAQDENTIIRFRIKAAYTGSNGAVVISPRNNDPLAWHGLFVAPVLNTKTRSYHLFIKADDWTNLWNYCAPESPMHVYLDPTTDTCCILNPDWDRRVPAVLGYGKKAIDIFTRYQGSAYNRINGEEFSQNYLYDPPSAPLPLRTLSWKFWLPSYNKVHSRDTVVLLKPRDSSCSFVTTYVMYKLARQVGLLAPNINFARLHINGGYYAYLMDVDYYSTDLAKDYINDFNRKKCRHKPSEEVGVIYKAIGYGCWGPIGPASEEFLWPDDCGTETLDRIALTYDQITHGSWINGASLLYDVLNILDGPDALNFTERNPDARQWFYENFDVNYMMHYLGLVNWAGIWDDINGNHMLAHRITDSKWHWTLWDMDSFFGQTEPCVIPNCTIFSGERGWPVGIYETEGAGNILKDHFIKSFRSEIEEHFALFADTVMTNNNTISLMWEAYNAINLTELQDSPTGYFSSTCMNDMTNWQVQRNAHIKSLYPTYSTTLDVCPNRPNITTELTSWFSVPGRAFPPQSTSSTENSISISWVSPNPNGYPIVNYILERKNNGTFTEIYSGSSPSFVDQNLTPRTYYIYRVKALNTVGEGQYSPEVAFQTALSSGTSSGSSSGQAESDASSLTFTLLTFVFGLFLL